MQINVAAGLLLVLLTGCASSPSATQRAASPTYPSDAVPKPERDAASAAIMAAAQRHDYHQAIAIENDWAKRYPTDLDFRHREPELYLAAGDTEGWERTRRDLLQTWARIRGTAPPPTPAGFTIDLFKAGQDVVIADQCYERAGRFGVLYRFTVISPDHQVHSFFTVESPDHDNQIAREMGLPSPVFTLDHFRPGVHETVAMLPGLPVYADLRQRVLGYMANPRPVSASSGGQPGLSTEGCAINP
jgi:hypothetical protein